VNYEVQITTTIRVTNVPDESEAQDCAEEFVASLSPDTSNVVFRKRDGAMIGRAHLMRDSIQSKVLGELT